MKNFLKFSILIIFILIFSLFWILILKSQKNKRGGINCGIENCHGLEIKCGSNVPNFCTEVYEIGDKCRKYAKCCYLAWKMSVFRDRRF